MKLNYNDKLKMCVYGGGLLSIFGGCTQDFIALGIGAGFGLSGSLALSDAEQISDSERLREEFCERERLCQGRWFKKLLQKESYDRSDAFYNLMSQMP